MHSWLVVLSLLWGCTCAGLCFKPSYFAPLPQYFICTFLRIPWILVTGLQNMWSYNTWNMFKKENFNKQFNVHCTLKLSVQEISFCFKRRLIDSIQSSNCVTDRIGSCISFSHHSFRLYIYEHSASECPSVTGIWFNGCCEPRILHGINIWIIYCWRDIFVRGGLMIVTHHIFRCIGKNCEKWLLALPCLSTWNNLAPTRRIFMKFYIWGFLKNLLRKFKHH